MKLSRRYGRRLDYVLFKKPLVACECRLSPVRRQLTRRARTRRRDHEIEKSIALRARKRRNAMHIQRSLFRVTPTRSPFAPSRGKPHVMLTVLGLAHESDTRFPSLACGREHSALRPTHESTRCSAAAAARSNLLRPVDRSRPSIDSALVAILFCIKMNYESTFKIGRRRWPRAR